MKRAFVSIVSSYVGCCVAAVLHRHGYEVVGSTRDEDNEDIEVIVAETVDANDEPSTANLALRSDVVVLTLMEDVRGADAVLTALQFSRNESGGPSHLLLLSTTMTWAKTTLATPAQPALAPDILSAFTSSPLSRPTSMRTSGKRSHSPTNAGGLPRLPSAISNAPSPPRQSSRQRTPGSPIPPGTANRAGVVLNSTSFRRRQPEPPVEPSLREGDYHLRQAPTGFLEHKRLEAAALRLRSPQLSACVVGAGTPYGVGEGPLIRLFCEAWKFGSDDTPLRLPTCTVGDNRLALIHVLDLSNVIGQLLLFPPEQPEAPPAPFPKTYILAVDGDACQPTAKEMTEAVGKAFGGSGKTRPMGNEELEDVLIDEPSALSLLFDLRFSNDGGVLTDMVSKGDLELKTWSKGFVTSAAQLAREFVSCRSLNAIKAVVLGPPGAGQGHICSQISQRYGLMRIDAKIATDGVFAALGKPLPERAPPEEKAAPAAKGKKSKDTKKALSKTEQAVDAQTALDALSPADRLLHHIQMAFDAAKVPLSEYTAFDAGGLSRMLPPLVVAEAARLVLDETKGQWLRRGYFLCDIPCSGGSETAITVFSEPNTSSQRLPSTATAVPSSVTNGDDSKNTHNNHSPADDSSIHAASGETLEGSSSAPKPAMINHALTHDESAFRPTHVVYLDAAADFIVRRTSDSQAGRIAQEGEEVGVALGGGAPIGSLDNEHKIREEIKKYFEKEGKECLQRNDREGEAKDQEQRAVNSEEDTQVIAGGVANRESRWLPATALAIRDAFSAKTQAIDAEKDMETLVHAVDLQLTGGDIPPFVRMLDGDDGREGRDRALTLELKEDDQKVAAASDREDRAGTEHTRGSAIALATQDSRDDQECRERIMAEKSGRAGLMDNAGLMAVLAKLTDRDAKEVEHRTRRHRAFLTEEVVPQVAAGLLAAAEVQPADPFDFLAEYLIREGQALQRKTEAEAELKYRAGLALLKEIEEWENKTYARVAAPGS